MNPLPITYPVLLLKKNLANINVNIGFKQAHLVLFGEFLLVFVFEVPLLISQNQLTGKKIHMIKRDGKVC